MKQIILGGVAAIVIAALAVVNVNLNSQSKNLLSDLALANVEALAQESGGGPTVQCYCKTHWFTPNVCTVMGDNGYCGGDPCSNHDGNCR